MWGKYPIVIIAPADIQLLLEGSEPRRNFLNQCLIQFDKDYTEALIKYNKLLKQRNTLLKSFSENKYWDQNLLDSYSEGMAGPASYIYEKRAALAEMISPHFEHMYNRISKNRESCKLKYKSNLADSDFLSLMEKNKEKDRILARTSAGIHKDDIKFIMNDVQLKPFGSQGQLKSFILALKLAQYHILKDQSKLTPILILDDLFDKLDKHRVADLLSILHDEAYGQVFLTDKDENDIPQFLEQISDDYAIFVIHEGSLKYSKEKR